MSADLDVQKLADSAYGLEKLLELEQVYLKHFDAKVGFELGLKAKELVEKLYPKASAAIDVAYITGTTVFRAVIGNIQEANEYYIGVKKQAVKTHGNSSWYFWERNHALNRVRDGRSTTGEPLVLAGGSVPIRIEGAPDFVLATITISGLKNHEDHYLSLSALKAIAEQQQQEK